MTRALQAQPVNARGLVRWRAYANTLAPLIEELEHAGALEGWRGDAPQKLDDAMPVPRAERPSP